MIHNKIREVAEAHGITTPFALSQRTGIAYGSARFLWNDIAKRIDFETLVRICCALDVSVGELFEVVCAEERAGS